MASHPIDWAEGSPAASRVFGLFFAKVPQPWGFCGFLNHLRSCFLCLETKNVLLQAFLMVQGSYSPKSPVFPAKTIPFSKTSPQDLHWSTFFWVFKGYTEPVQGPSWFSRFTLPCVLLDEFILIVFVDAVPFVQGDLEAAPSRTPRGAPPRCSLVFLWTIQSTGGFHMSKGRSSDFK